MVYLNNMKTKNQTTVIDYKNQEHIIPIWSLEDFYLDEPDMPIQTSLAYKLNNDLNNGYYIEIGAGHYKKQNNTYYLENKYNWTGISIDIEQPMVDIFNNNRKNKCIQADAITFNWEQYLVENNFPKKIDFLSIDVDFHSHPHANLLALLNLPLTKYQFNIISIEHGSGIFYEQKKLRDMQRDILSTLGYSLLIRGTSDDIWSYEKINTHNGFDQLSGAKWWTNL